MGGYEFQRAELDALEGVLRDASAEPMSLTLPLLRHITNDFSPESQIGQDDSAVVYLGVLPSGCRVAVKKLQLHHCLDDENEDAFLIEYDKMKDTFQNEVSAAIKASHKNTVRLIGYCHHTQEQIVEYEGKQVFAGVLERLICTEYVPDGTLCGHIEGT
ncbi:unnamed protein product [Triticum turgidum subsp. durum]|uniref:Protein kinase domain-containing protein n=1 Tax=Triticum turgidum subsp. durum TaxID=4567 RepID=A0A9R0V3W1_TRITD|nr:unnamed protein product [Triticum turgidum subsp. durum]